MKLLLELNGVDVNAKSIDGSSPLHYAVKVSYKHIAHLVFYYIILQIIYI